MRHDPRHRTKASPEGLPISLKDPETRPELEHALADLGEGLKRAQAKRRDLDPREAAKALAVFQTRVEATALAWERLQRLQKASGSVRQLVADPGIDWDAADDAVRLLQDLANHAGEGVARFRQEMGSSPLGPRPDIAWAIEVFALWRRHDVEGKLGKRDGEGRFRRFLEAVAAPLGVRVPWTSVHDAIRKHERGTSPA